MEIENVYSMLTKEIPELQIKKNESMKNHTTFKIGGEADLYIVANTIEQLCFILKVARDNQLPLTILGNGSNVLVRDGGIRGIVVKPNLQKIDIEEKETNIKINVGSGVLLGKLGMECYKRSITGFEFACGIPGTMGGAIRMNAGAHGGEMKDLVLSTNYMDEQGKICTISNSEHQFNYRSSWFKDHFGIILETTIELKKGSENDILAKMKEYKKFRQDKQPISMPSAGSTFKRGEDFITAQLIDSCGLKGYKIGGAVVSEKHAGFIVNNGGATAKDVLDLVKYVQEQVYEKYKKEIKLEIEVLGEF